MSIESIIGEVVRYPARHVVVTGGEPMIMPEIVPLTEALRRAGMHITVETAGTVFAPVACDLMSISPKLANSTPWEREGGRWAAQHERLRIQKQVLCRLISEYEHQLKFVVQRPEDVEEIRALVAQLRAGRSKVVLMPEGTDAATIRERGTWLAELCKEEGFRFSPRLHIELWGNRRGV
jgi:7-carboxy-7-deazaguanine synthase